MYEKNIVGTYSIRDYYPIFQHETNDRRRVDPVKYPNVEVRDLEATRVDVSEHDAVQDWEEFSHKLKDRKEQERRPRPQQPSPEKQEAQNEAQKQVNDNIKNRILALRFVHPEQQQAQAVRQHLQQVQKPVPEHQTRILREGEHWVTRAGGPGALTLAQVMTRKVVCLLEDSSLEQAAALCNQRHLSGLPILNEAEQLVGVLSMKDILSGLVAIENQHAFYVVEDVQSLQIQAMLQDPVKLHMSTRVITARPETPVKEACSVMHHHGIRRLLVTRGDKVLGVFSAQDAVRLLAQADVFLEMEQ